MAEIVVPYYPDPENVVHSPGIPFCGAIPGGVSPGKIIEICGQVPYGAESFNINLSAGRDRGSAKADMPLHISVRFKVRNVVRNTLHNGQWGNEEKGGIFPFSTGKQFTLFIMVEENCFRIAVNGQHYCEYAHRLAFSTITMLSVEGSVQIAKIEYNNQRSQGPQGCIPPTGNPSHSFQPVMNPSIPVSYPIYGGLYPGMMIYISGRSSASINRFNINLQCGTAPYPPPDIAFHLDARYYNKTLIRNTRRNNQWETEELSVPYFPFQPAVYFDMIIRVESDSYMIALNGQHFLEYKHRLFPLSRIDTLCIENDIIVSSIRIA